MATTTGMNEFPPPSYSVAFFSMLLKLASERGISLSSLKLRKKKSCRNKRQDTSEMTLLQLLALNALDLTAPAANNLLLENRKNDWIQLSGHEGAFAPAGHGTIWKRRAGSDDTELRAYRALMADPARDVVPRFYKEVEYKGEFYIEMQDLLHGFNDPHIMDIKMGTRTFTEQEVVNQTPRSDLYQKMAAVDPDAPTEEERRTGAITKLRYMQFREELSSTSTLGFRIEAVKYGSLPPVTNLKTVKGKEEIVKTLGAFLSGSSDKTKNRIVGRLKSIRSTVEKSPFFQNHEMIGSSMLIVYDKCKCGVWTIDFAKTAQVAPGNRIDHRSKWQNGNKEDGYLSGLDNLIRILKEATKGQSS